MTCSPISAAVAITWSSETNAASLNWPGAMTWRTTSGRIGRLPDRQNVDPNHRAPHEADGLERIPDLERVRETLTL